MTDLRTLYDLTCPQCGQADTLHITISCMAVLTADGAEAIGDHAWDETSPCRCPACGHTSAVHAFTSPPEACSAALHRQRPCQGRGHEGSHGRRHAVAAKTGVATLPVQKPRIPKLRHRTGSWSTFERRFKPIVRDDDTVLWERDELPKDIDPHRVWTVLDCDGRFYLSPGYRFVNRFAYVVCVVPWSEDDERQPDYLYD